MGVLSNFAEKVSAILFRSGPVFVRQSGDSQTSWNSIGIVSDPRISWKPVSTAKSNTGREHALGADFEVSFKMLQTGYGTEFANIDALINVPLDVKFCDERLSLAGVGTAGVNSADGVMISGVSMVASAEVDFQGGESGIILEFMFRLTVDDFNRYLIGSNWTLGITEDVTTPVQFAWQPLYDGLVPKVTANGVDREKSFSRASTATYVDGGGIVRTAKVDEPRYTAAGVPIVEAAGQNYCTYSQDTANWLTDSQVTVVDGGLSDPSGGLDASSITENTATSAHFIYYPYVNNVAVGDFAVSLYAKSANSGRGVCVEMYDSSDYGNRVQQWFDLTDGTIGQKAEVGTFTIKSAKTESLANGWYRVSFVANATAFTSGTTVRGAVLLANDAFGTFAYTGNGTGAIHIFGLQVEQADFASSYIPSDSAVGVRSADSWAGAGTFGRTSAATYVKGGVVKYAGTNEPRIQDTGLLIEPTRTNYEAQSQNLPVWTLNDVTVSENSTTAPDGTNTADTLIASAGTANHRAVRTPATGGGTITVSAYVKKATTPYFRLYGYNGTDGVPISYGINLDTESVIGSSVGTGGFEAVGNGWYRIFCTATVSVSTQFMLYITDSAGAVSFNAVGGESVYLWGMQAEVGSFPTSYIPTAGSSVVRSEDTLSWLKTATPFDAVGAEGITIHWKHDPDFQAGGTRGLGLGKNTGATPGYFHLTQFATNQMAARVDSTTMVVVSPTGTPYTDATLNAQGTTLTGYFGDGAAVTNTIPDITGGLPVETSGRVMEVEQVDSYREELDAIVIAKGVLTPAQMRKYLR